MILMCCIFIPCFLVNSGASGGWGAYYLNGAKLQVQENESSEWRTLLTLSGCADGKIDTFPVNCVVKAIRVYRDESGYVGVACFMLNDSATPGVPTATGASSSSSSAAAAEDAMKREMLLGLLGGSDAVATKSTSASGTV